MILPKLVQEKPYEEVPHWPRVHVWANGTIIVDDRNHVLIWDDDSNFWRRYEWAALSDFPKPSYTLERTEALQFILERTGHFEFPSKTDT